MTYDPAQHRRRSIRLKGFDYAQPGAYFVTIVTQGRECLFGDVMDGQMCLNDAGRMVERWWRELGNKYPRVIPDACVVMPNHFHGTVMITDDGNAHVGGAHTGADAGTHAGVPLQPTGGFDGVGADLCVCPDPHIRPQSGARRDTVDGAGAHAGAHTGAPLPRIVQWFKTMTTNEYIRGVKTLGWQPFPGRLWQRNYYEHIIRNNTSLNGIRQYIASNPAQWADDHENPERATR